MMFTLPRAVWLCWHEYFASNVWQRIKNRDRFRTRTKQTTGHLGRVHCQRMHEDSDDLTMLRMPKALFAKHLHGFGPLHWNAYTQDRSGNIHVEHSQAQSQHNRMVSQGQRENLVVAGPQPQR